MAYLRAVQIPLRAARAGKRDLRTQFAALCWRARRGRVEVLLVTARRSGRWIPPRDWPMRGMTPAEAAAREAWEEAGAVGRTSESCLGLYTYYKNRLRLPCAVAVFPLEVRRLARAWPEAAERRRRWMARAEAAARVREPELARMIASFEPRPGHGLRAPLRRGRRGNISKP